MPMLDANGCAVSSKRHAVRSKPSDSSTRSANCFCCSAGKSPSRNEVSTGSRCATSATICLQRRLELVEDRCDLGRLHAALVVVEQRVVRVVVRREALDVPVAQLEVPLEVRAEQLGSCSWRAPRARRRSRARRRARSRRAGRRGRARPSRSRRASCGSGWRRRTRTGSDSLVASSSSSSSRPTSGSVNLLVDDPAERRELLGAHGAARGRHEDTLVPAERGRRPSRGR